jgi:hypothetical protein
LIGGIPERSRTRIIKGKSSKIKKLDKIKNIR